MRRRQIIPEKIVNLLDARDGQVHVKADPNQTISVGSISVAAIYEHGTDGQHIMAAGKHQCEQV